ncbi:hypothetical protein [Mesorhizobium tamadayense]|uniref:hypothetical protein n=1 Tax=Mesorhizobium tamadayense TaxID=425306 RepID=UPI00142DC98D|nr:hypothetical protein [Mesorhizobium tamadayense]
MLKSDGQSPESALPVIALPGIRFKVLPIYRLDTGRNLSTHFAMLAIGETGDGSAPLPVTIRGEDAGRQVRGSAILESLGSPPYLAGSGLRDAAWRNHPGRLALIQIKLPPVGGLIAKLYRGQA